MDGQLLATIATFLSIIGVFAKILFDYSRLKHKSEEAENSIKENGRMIEDLQRQFTELSKSAVTTSIELDSFKIDFADHKKGSSNKFSELYNSRNEQTKILQELVTTVSMLKDSINQRLLDLKETIEKRMS